jgi:hypothetical protein
MAAGTDYYFSPMPDDLQPYGPVGKENLDIIRVVYDLTCWLEETSPPEDISLVSYPVILAQPNLQLPQWQTDYPLDNTSATDVPVDEYPLSVVDVSITGLSNQVQMRLGAGTPQLTYVVSLTVTGSTTRRRKQLDLLVTIEEPLNPGLVRNMDVDPDALTPPLILTGGNATIPQGYAGRVYVENGSNAPMTITLPAAATPLQVISPVDINGNFATYPVTYTAAPGDTIEGAMSYVSDINHDDLRFEWTGSQWIVLINRYGMLG